MSNLEKDIEKIKKKIKKLSDGISKSKKSARKISSACNEINNSWSGSDLVGHSNLFYENFEIPPHNKRFSIEWGLLNGVPDGWSERSNEEVIEKIESESGASTEKLDEESDHISNEFDKLRKEAIISISSISREAATEIEKFNLRTKIDIFNQYWNKQIITRDSEAIYSGRIVPIHKYYDATASFVINVSDQLNEFLYLVDKTLAQNKSIEQKIQSGDDGRAAYIDKNTLLRISRIKNKNFDLSRLILFCNELDDNYSLKNYHSCAMLLRAILDHIPPIFQKKDFASVCAQHGGKSFKNIMRPLNETAKKIGDDYLHTQISNKVLVVTKTQISFQANLDVLLNEIASILEKK